MYLHEISGEGMVYEVESVVSSQQGPCRTNKKTCKKIVYLQLVTNSKDNQQQGIACCQLHDVSLIESQALNDLHIATCHSLINYNCSTSLTKLSLSEVGVTSVIISPFLSGHNNKFSFEQQTL